MRGKNTGVKISARILLGMRVFFISPRMLGGHGVTGCKHCFLSKLSIR